MTEIAIHHLTADEWPVLRDLRLVSLAESPVHLWGDLTAERLRSERDWRVLSRRGVWLIASVDGVPAGLLHCVRDPETAEYYTQSMWVAPAYRRLGIAGRLLDAIEPAILATGRRAIFLWVLDGDEGVASFYRRRGFVATGVSQPLGSRYEVEFRRGLLAVLPRNASSRAQ